MVPTRNLVQDQQYDSLSSTTYIKNPLIMANKEDRDSSETRNKEVIKEETDPTNPKDWLQLGFGTVNREIINGAPIELQLFTERPPSQQQRQITSTLKRNRQCFKNSWDPVTGGEIRVVAPPRRPQTGVWLILCASQNQVKEPFLPQIERSYIRFKESNMTVRVLMKYLANKLGLVNELEVEIFCKGHSLPPSLMLQYVRDHIWKSRYAAQLAAQFTATDHLMTLHYSSSR